MTYATDLERLIKARHTVAQLVLMDRVYLPIFQRLERDIADLETERDTLDRARHLVQSHKAAG